MNENPLPARFVGARQHDVKRPAPAPPASRLCGHRSGVQGPAAPPMERHREWPGNEIGTFLASSDLKRRDQEGRTKGRTHGDDGHRPCGRDLLLDRMVKTGVLDPGLRHYLWRGWGSAPRRTGAP